MNDASFIVFIIGFIVMNICWMWALSSVYGMLKEAQDRVMSMSNSLAQYQMSKAPAQSPPPEIVVNHPITGQPLRMVHRGGGEYGAPDEDVAPSSTVSDVEGEPPRGKIEWEER